MTAELPTIVTGIVASTVSPRAFDLSGWPAATVLLGPKAVITCRPGNQRGTGPILEDVAALVRRRVTPVVLV